jgi:glyceraldehyde 3-phosphate dehydrogenase
MRVAINGFGRIGRLILRRALEKKIKVVAINDLTDINTLAHLFKYDSVYGIYKGKVKVIEDYLVIDKNKIKVFSEKDPTLLPWKEFKVDLVIESTGRFTKRGDAIKHLEAGSKKVLISANYKGDQAIKTLVKGVNLNIYNKKTDHIISKGSCTTTCLAPIVKVLNDKFGIERGLMTTVHSVTSSQSIVDSPNKDLRRARTLLDNIIPTKTGAAIAISRVIPELKNKIDGMAIRIPTRTGSIVDLSCIVKRKTSLEKVNKTFKKSSEKGMKGIIQYCKDEIVGADIIGNTHSSIFDSKLTKVQGKLVKILAWYDNEYGYSCRMVDMIKFMSKK